MHEQCVPQVQTVPDSLFLVESKQTRLPNQWLLVEASLSCANNDTRSGRAA